ncbi:MAG: hypothetical protein ACTHLN_05185 [Tepidisphaeraceae bacterium]
MAQDNTGYPPKMSLLAIGIICLVLSATSVPLASRLPSRSSVFTSVVVLAILGGIVGLVCSFYVRWQPSPTIRYLGFPFPAMLLQLENGEWVDYVGGPITAVMNVIWFAAVCVVPVFVWVLFQRLRRPRVGG